MVCSDVTCLFPDSRGVYYLRQLEVYLLLGLFSDCAHFRSWKMVVPKPEGYHKRNSAVDYGDGGLL